MKGNWSKLDGILLVLNGSRYLQNLIGMDPARFAGYAKIRFEGQVEVDGTLTVWVEKDGKSASPKIEVGHDISRLWRAYRQVVAKARKEFC